MLKKVKLVWLMSKFNKCFLINDISLSASVFCPAKVP
jgi:hypothetical protein